MFTTVEARVPFMDKAFIEHCMNIPSYFRINGNCEKWALREIFKNELPDAIIKRGKTGMNEGSGFGKNTSNKSVYFEAVREHYDNDNKAYEKDRDTCIKYANDYSIKLNDIEEIYNFARFVEYQYVRYSASKNRLQLNTQLLK
jgi:asparagine synthetase B (glutamine-hydrolysing)